MKLSTRSIYGVRLMFELAINNDKGPIQLSYISKITKISEKYLSQLVIPLRVRGLINSERGSSGGYLLARPLSKISVYEIVECLEGNLDVIDMQSQKESNNTLNEIWKNLNNTIKEKLSGYSLNDLMEMESSNNTEVNYSI
jgi:Rrf2 family protein